MKKEDEESEVKKKNEVDEEIEEEGNFKKKAK